MTIRELVELLQQFESDLEVSILVSGDGEPYESLSKPEYDDNLNQVVIIVE